jgi:uncharacterized membrane protein affecting hemolysin expression
MEKTENVFQIIKNICVIVIVFYAMLFVIFMIVGFIVMGYDIYISPDPEYIEETTAFIE